MARAPILERIEPDADGPVLDPRRIRKFYFLMAPVLLPLIVGGAGIAVVSLTESAEGTVFGGILIGLGVLLFIAYCVYETCFIGIFPARCYLKWLRQRIDRRSDPVVRADDPDAFFVQVIPREKWTVSMGENAADVGLLRVDEKKQELRYEGDRERWVVPAECIRSFRLRSFTPPGGLPAMNEHTVVMLIVELDDREILETPLAAHPVHFEYWSPGKRRRGAEVLEDLIGHLVDPERWPAVNPDRLWPLVPPPVR
ncbi:MAG TPA: hypothetical protein VM597_32215 [Gemmataceae bacterium]|nr:hypothetical protein [Gemmataceae bacterium]